MGRFFTFAGVLALLVVVADAPAFAPRPGMARPGGAAAMNRAPSFHAPQMARPAPRPAGAGPRPGMVPQQRPNMAQMQRRQMPQMNRPQMQRPQTLQMQRPNMAQMQRPQMPQIANRPAMPATRPGIVPQQRPSLPQLANRPQSLPGQAATRPNLPTPGGGAAFPNRPQILPGQVANRPTIPGGGGGGEQWRPTTPVRPGGGGSGTQWPTNPIRPSPLPAPIGPVRPGGGGSGEQWQPGNRPWDPNRPGWAGGGEQWRPGNNRPWDNNRPWNNNRPWDNRPIVNRPVINQPDVNINNVNNTVNSWQNNAVVNRPGYGYGAGYGYGSAYAPYYGYHSNWYNGAWSAWNYAPGVWASNAAALGWLAGAGTVAYSNPFYVAPPATTVVVQGTDYSQPLPPPPAPVQQTVVQYAPAEDTAAAPAPAPAPTVSPPAGAPPTTPQVPDDPKIKAALQVFDRAREEFKRSDYAAAQRSVEQAITDMPSDPVLHEFRALTLFAQKKYRDAAAAVYAVLSAGPGWSWDTLKSLYPDVDTYTRQLRDLEAYAKENPKAADARFLLAYHSLVLNQPEAAAKVLEQVVALQPQDQLSAQILKSLKSPPPAADQPAVKPS
jgi:TolA-binding protein